MDAVDNAKIGSIVNIDDKKKYTGKQRGALHLWCKMCAESLNDHGIYFRRKAVFGDKEIEIPWTKDLFKDSVYKPILEAVTGKTSTEEQDSVTPSSIALIISKQYADNGLICPPWPSNR